MPGIDMLCILTHTSGVDQTWAFLPSDPCSALNSGAWPGGCLSQSPGCSGFLLGLAYGGTTGRLEGRRMEEARVFPPSLSSSSISSNSAHISMVPDSSWWPWLLGNMPPPFVPSTVCCPLLLISWLLHGSILMPTNFTFLKWCPSEKFFNSWLCHLSYQASSLSFSVTFHLYVCLHHCNPFPALNSFCCKYLEQFLFLCLDADWLTDWGRNQPHFNEEETEGQGGQLTCPVLKIGADGAWF